MRTESIQWQPGSWTPAPQMRDAHLVLAFGSGAAVEDGGAWDELRRLYPDAHVVGCSTAGEIQGTHVFDDRLVATAIRFERARAEVRFVQVCADSEAAGRTLGQALPKDGLRHVLVLTDGQHVNGSRFAHGLQSQLPAGVAATGGLAGDGDRFRRTLVAHDGRPEEDLAVAVGLYGPIQAGFGSLGGWDPFGPRRVITRARGNVLYELDGQPALQLYRRYLGEHAQGLPSSGLLFPLSVVGPTGNELVRTILGVDEASQSLTFAGDVPEGAVARLMKANFERLVDGAENAARDSTGRLHADPELALLISCVGRKLVLRQRTEEELEAVRHVVGPRTTLTGFYSYGEICPAAPDADCELHNQTMTITTLSETYAPAA